jgi:3-hydroxyisobutyrate dehydrogenase
MAATARRAGRPLIVWNRDPAAATQLAAQGVEVASSVTDAVTLADVVITMVTNADAGTAIATDGGLLTALKSGAVWAQMSTVGVAGTGRLDTLVQERRPDTHFVDAPVSGSKVPAE